MIVQIELVVLDKHDDIVEYFGVYDVSHTYDSIAYRQKWKL